MVRVSLLENLALVYSFALFDNLSFHWAVAWEEDCGNISAAISFSISVHNCGWVWKIFPQPLSLPCVQNFMDSKRNTTKVRSRLDRLTPNLAPEQLICRRMIHVPTASSLNESSIDEDGLPLGGYTCFISDTPVPRTAITKIKN